MESYKRTIEINDVQLNKYIAEREAYRELSQPHVDAINANNEEMNEAMDIAKKVIERVKKENAEHEAKLSKNGEKFSKKKMKIQKVMEKVQDKEKAHNYEYLESVDIVDGQLQGVMVDALKKAEEDTKKTFDNLDK